ncbi:MAG: phage holin family protein [Methanobacterium paludis]|nr:phage holin family protein [Methanobacterium paludis]
MDQVHHTLGRHRDDDTRNGWISGLDDEKGELHPTRGGLRIGKKLNERRPDEPPSERLEWDQDGQYYHYLTKWMQALNQVSRVTGDPKYTRWALELAKAAHTGFTYVPPSSGRKRMYWKMSIDLTYPLVPSMGQHDPLDGFITYSELQMSTKNSEQYSRSDLSAEIADMANICQGKSWATNDPLGIGGLLSDALRIAQLMRDGFAYGNLLEVVMESAMIGMGSFVRDNTLRLPADYRLAFRELGISIGLKGVEKLREWIEENPDLFKNPLRQQVEAIREYVPIGKTIERFWMDSKNRETCNWTEHREINMVMLATSLVPNGFLLI